jgi:tetratricopeptide (TPR) repeat protein
MPRALEGSALCELGGLRHAQGRLDQARELLTEALTVFRTVGDRAGEARACLRLAAVDRDSGNPRTDRADLALTISRALTDPEIEADARNVLGTIHDRLGRHPAAIAHHRQAHELAGGAGLRYPEAEALIGLGAAHLHAGEHERARAHLDRAVTLTRRHGYRLLADRATALLSRARTP